MSWTKIVSHINGEIIRIACLPEGTASLAPTFAVREPERFAPCAPEPAARARKSPAAQSLKSPTRQVFRLGDVTISIVQDGERLSPGNLQVEWANPDGRANSWRPGDVDAGNLGGPFLSLDLLHRNIIADQSWPYDPMKGFDSHVCNPYHLLHALKKVVQEKLGSSVDEHEWWVEFLRHAEGEPPKLFKKLPAEVHDVIKRVKSYPPGYLSRSGMSILLDDSLAWDAAAQWPRRSADPNVQALYLVHYGKDYKKGLGLLASLLGPIPQVPEWVLGVWFSCFRKMGQKHYRKLKEDFDRHDLPLDVVVVDTDWHRCWWHGFDWNATLFPKPDDFAKWLRENRLHAAFNVHPQYIPGKDSRLSGFLKRTGAKKEILTKENAASRFYVGCQSVDLLDKKQALAYFDVFHKPIEKQGCDLWWVDGCLTADKGRDATAWLNEMYFQYANQGRGKETSLVLSRTHGLGAHRSTLLFTGDTYSQWEVLDQEVVMTPKAANCLVAYVSHDIGAFVKGSSAWKKNKPPDDLYIRWTQFGCLSPMMRFHSDHGIREPWRFAKKTLEITRVFLQFRRAIGPYLAALAREARQTGVALCRPMFYEFPEDEAAYKHEHQYMLGGDILVAPATRPDGWTTIWFPRGRWRHAFFDRIVEGPAVITEKVPIETMPVYLREGARIPYWPLAPAKSSRQGNAKGAAKGKTAAKTSARPRAKTFIASADAPPLARAAGVIPK